MTDTEILDYLSEAVKQVTFGGWTAYDVQLGRVSFTIDQNPTRRVPLRELLIAAIGRDQQRVADETTRRLAGG